jgi:uncharacterized protein YrrD
MLSDARIVPIDAVRSYGRDAIVIVGDDAVIEGTSAPDIPNESGRSLAGMQVFSSEGERVGSIADVYFEEDDGRIVGFEVSGGVIGDIASGTRFLPVEDIDRVGDEIVYVRPESASDLGPVPGGTGGAAAVLEDVKSKVGDAAQAAGDKLGEARTDVDRRLAEGSDASTGPGAMDGSDLVGRRSGSDVTDPDGRIIVANGQRISERHVERANASGQVDALRAAADRWSQAERDRVISGTIEQVTDAAGSAWDRFMGKISELTDESGRRISEQQTKARLAAINDAVGRPVTKVILDRSDEVVLNLGDIITHEAIQRAYDAGILDSLLDSAYKGDVAFERDEMRAPSEGTSTVEKASGSAAVVAELQTSIEEAEAQRQEQSEQKRMETEAARQQREAEREQRAQARAEAAQRAEAGEPLQESDETSSSTESESSSGEAVSTGSGAPSAGRPPE